MQHMEPLPPLTGADIQEVIDRMNPHMALGTDSWTIPELRLLSPQLLKGLADFYTKAEAVGRWPTALTCAIVALIPKEGAQTEAELRPIGLTPHPLPGLDVCSQAIHTPHGFSAFMGVASFHPPITRGPHGLSRSWQGLSTSISWWFT